MDATTPLIIIECCFFLVGVCTAEDAGTNFSQDYQGRVYIIFKYKSPTISVRLMPLAKIKRNLTGSHVLVDVFFLCVVEAHKGLDRLDDALRVAD